MYRRNGLLIGMGLLLGVTVPGCFSPLSYLNPDFLAALGVSRRVASLPGDAPGLLVSAENRTNRWITAQISYRDDQDSVQTFSTTLGPADSTAQMLVCPISEITLGDVSDLGQAGAIVYLADLSATAEGAPSVQDVPFLEVDPFGTLLREGVNYECGDELIFVVQASGATRSGYQVFAYFRGSGG